MDDDYGGTDGGEPNYSGLDETWRDISPDFGGAGNGSGASEGGRGQGESAAEQAREAGRASEDSAASGGGSTRSGSRNAAREAEGAGGEGGFRNSVTGKDEKKKKGSMRGSRGFLRFTATGLLVGIITGAAALVGGSQILAPFGLIANGLDIFNSLRTGMSTREVTLIKAQLGVRSASASGMYSVDEMNITDEQIQRYARNGIIYYDGGGVRMLIYQDRDSKKWLGVVGSEAQIGGAPRSVTVNGKTYNLDEILDLDTALAEYDDFFEASSRSTRTTKGHIAGWYDAPATEYLIRLGRGSRAIRRKHGGKNEQKTDAEIIEDAKRGNISDADGVSSSATSDGDSSNDDEMKDLKNLSQEEQISSTTETVNTGPPEKQNKDKTLSAYDIDDEKVTYTEKENGVDVEKEREMHVGNTKSSAADGDDSLSAGMDSAQIETSLGARAMKIAAAVGQVANFGCTVMKVVAGINAVIAGIELANIINWITGFLEAIDKTKSGDGGNELAYYMNQLTTKGTMMGSDEDGHEIVISENTSALESPAFNQFFGGSAISEGDATRKFSIEGATQASMRGAVGGDITGHILAATSAFSNSLEAYRACLAVEGISAIADVIGDFISLGSKSLFEGLIGVAKSIALQEAMTMLISAMIPKVGQWLAMDLISNMVGEDAAYAMNSGFNIYLGRQHQASSGKPGTYDEVVAMHRENQKILAEEARYDRLTHSPFDITNKNTFLGSLAYAAIPIGISMGSSPLSVVSKVVNQVGSSTLALFPSVQAAGVDTWYNLSLNTDCPSLSQIGLVGDAYCNPYFVSDLSSNSKDPAAVFLDICKDNFENDCDLEGSDGEYSAAPVVKKGSELSKWAIACATREAPYGVVDAQTLSAMKIGSGLPDALQKGISFIPILSGIWSAGQTVSDIENLDWGTGKGCVEHADFSRFSDDQRNLENAGLIEESAVTAFLREYYEENPLDNSYEGVLARYTGMTKDGVEEILGFIEYAEYLAQYDASERKQLVEEPEVRFFYDEDRDDNRAEAIVAESIIYLDIKQEILIA